MCGGNCTIADQLRAKLHGCEQKLHSCEKSAQLTGYSSTAVVRYWGKQEGPERERKRENNQQSTHQYTGGKQTVDVGPVPDASVMKLVSYVSRRYADPITYEAVWNESDHCIAQAEQIT